MDSCAEPEKPASTSRPARGEWIEIACRAAVAAAFASRPARGEWIEIIIIIKQDNDGNVSPREGRVD